MNAIDLLIILFIISFSMRGYHIGLVRQAGSTLGFIAGLFAGSWIGSLVIAHVQNSLDRSLASFAIVLLGSFIGMTIGEVISAQLKVRLLQNRSLNAFDGTLGSIMGAVTLLLAVWLAAAILILGPPSGFQQALKNSRILSSLSANLPPATQVLSSLNKLIDPNGFPQVFSGLEPHPGTTKVPSLGAFDTVVADTRKSVVKVEGTGCGGIVEGSGFVITNDEIATNAHVVAGVASPKVLDASGIHNTQVVWFDPDLDLAVLKVNSLAGKPLPITATEQPTGTPSVILGYPGGGGFDAEPAAIISHFDAYGRNIYGQGRTVRDVYSVQAKVIPGNSGGPLIGADGHVLGIVFATSTTYNNVGYALTGHQVAGELAQAMQSTTTIGTGQCSE
jgi:S1-C subfamily serine protease